MSIILIGTDGSLTDLEMETEPDLAFMQGKVGGYIEVVRKSDNALQLVIDEEGKLKGYSFNLVATTIAETLGMLGPDDFIVGPALLLTGASRLT